MGKYAKWVVFVIALAVLVDVAYRVASRTPRPVDTSSDLARLHKISDTRAQARAAIPQPMTLDQAKAEYKAVLAKCTAWRKEMTGRADKLRPAFRANPADGETARQLVQCLSLLGEAQEARKVAESWTKASPKDPDAWHRLASCCWDLGLTGAGYAAANKAAALQGRPSVYSHAQRSYRAHDEFDSVTAMDQATMAVSAATTDEQKSAAQRCLAYAHLRLNSEVILTDEERREHSRAAYEAAKKSLAAAETLEGHLLACEAAGSYAAELNAFPGQGKEDADDLPEPGEAYDHLKLAQEKGFFSPQTWSAVLSTRLGRDDYGAWSAAKIAYYLCPHDPIALTGLAVASEKAGVEPDATESRKLLAAVLAGKAPGKWPRMTEAQLRHAAGTATELPPKPGVAPQVAVVLYPYVRQRLSGYSRAMYDMSVALLQAGRSDEALEAIQFAMQHPGMMEDMGAAMLVQAGLAAQATGDPALADEYVAQATAYPGFGPRMRNEIAWVVAVQGGDYDWALGQIDVALEASPTDLALLDTKAYLLYRKGEFAESRKLCQQLIDANMGGFAIGYMGLMYAREGNREKALECLRQVQLPAGANESQLPPEFAEVRQKLEAELRPPKRKPK